MGRRAHVFESIVFAMLFGSLTFAQGLPTLEPIPSPAAGDGGQLSIPSESISNEPTPADPSTRDLEPTPAEIDSSTAGDFDNDAPLQLAPASDSAIEESTVGDFAVEQASFEEAVEGPALEPIVDGSTSVSSGEIILSSPSTTSVPVEYQPQPIQLPTASYATPAIQNPSDCGCNKGNTSTTVVNNQVIQNQVSQVIQSPQPATTYIPQPATSYVSQPAPARQRVVVQQPTARPATYYRVVPQQPQQRAPQPTRVVVQQRTPEPVRYYATPAQPQPTPTTIRVRIQPTEQVRVQPRVTPAGYTQVQITETTRFVPVQVQSRPTTTVVVPASGYVPFQPFRNAARRRGY